MYLILEQDNSQECLQKSTIIYFPQDTSRSSMDMTPYFSGNGITLTLKSGKLTIVEFENRDALGRSVSNTVADLCAAPYLKKTM